MVGVKIVQKFTYTLFYDVCQQGLFTLKIVIHQALGNASMPGKPGNGAVGVTLPGKELQASFHDLSPSRFAHLFKLFCCSWRHVFMTDRSVKDSVIEVGKANNFTLFSFSL